jgi:DNA invertase Pin-like site-specific DNA recombinase
MSTKAAIYARLSQDRDRSKGGTDRQVKDCRALAKREGLTVVQVYTDDDRSAYNGKHRPAFEELLRDLDRYDVLVYWKTDRLVRRTVQFWKVVEACEAANVRLLSVLDPVDTSTPIGQGVAGMLAAVGQQESHNIGLRVARQQADAASDGRLHGGRRAYGYTADGMKLVPSEVRTLREAAKRLLGGESVHSVCEDWNARGIPTADGVEWRVATLRRMIVRPRLAGLSVYRGAVVGEGQWPAIITREQHEQLVARFDDPDRKRGRPASYLLTGLVRCGRCGSVLRSSWGSGIRRWSCQRLPGEEGSRCASCVIRADRVDELVEAEILARLDSPAVARALRKPAKTKQRATVTQVSDLEAKLVQLGIDHDLDVISRREWLERRKRLEQRLDAARSEVAHENGSSALTEFAGGVDVARRWQRLDLDGQRRVAAALIDRVTILPPPKRMPRFDPDRVEIVWKV